MQLKCAIDHGMHYGHPIDTALHSRRPGLDRLPVLERLLALEVRASVALGTLFYLVRSSIVLVSIPINNQLVAHHRLRGIIELHGASYRTAVEIHARCEAATRQNMPGSDRAVAGYCIHCH